MAYIYDLSDAWAASGTVFTGIKLAVTDTASAADSMLMDLQVGGASLLRMFKNGELRISTSTGFFTTGSSGTNSMIFGNPAISSAPAAIQTGVGLTLKSDVGFAWSNGAVNGTRDTILARDAANTLAQRNGVNAQAFNLYNTYTDASNYERGFMRFVSNALEIGTGAAGTGTGRDVSIKTQSGRYLTLSNGSTLNSNAVYTRFYDGSTVVANINVNSQQFVIASGGSFTFSSGADSFSTAVDTGIARSAAGVAKITNGSTGTGKLIFIVPTTDPGITGALWNNAGTLAISA